MLSACCKLINILQKQKVQHHVNNTMQECISDAASLLILQCMHTTLD